MGYLKPLSALKRYFSNSAVLRFICGGSRQKASRLFWSFIWVGMATGMIALSQLAASETLQDEDLFFKSSRKGAAVSEDSPRPTANKQSKSKSLQQGNDSQKSAVGSAQPSRLNSLKLKAGTLEPQLGHSAQQNKTLDDSRKPHQGSGVSAESRKPKMASRRVGRVQEPAISERTNAVTQSPLPVQRSATMPIASGVSNASGLAQGSGAILLAQNDSNPQARSISVANSDRNYKIGVDDQIQVSVWGNPDLSMAVPVRPDGKISTPLVGDVHAAGKTPMQLARDIQVKLAKYIREPNVSVILVGLSSHEYISRVRVTGAVRNPVSLNHRKGMTVLDVVLSAGGPNEFASSNRTVLYRQDSSGKKSIRIKLDDILRKGRLESNFLLKPGDVITVPESLF